MVVLPQLLWRQCDLFLQDQLSGGVSGGEFEESCPSCFFCCFCVLCSQLRPPLFVVVGRLYWLLFFQHFGGSSKVAYL
jgi:hypothetical protein